MTDVRIAVQIHPQHAEYADIRRAAAEAEELDQYLTQGTESFAESLTYFPAPNEFRLGPDEYLEHVANAKRAIDIPLIASLNGVSKGGWTDYAKKIEGR